MALSTYVYISGVNNLSDARYCAGMGVDTLGFNLDATNDSYTDIDKFKEITGWVAGVKLAGEFGNLEAAAILDIVPKYTLDIIVTSNPKAITSLKQLNLPIFLEIDTKTAQNKLSTILADHKNDVQQFIITSSTDEIDETSSSHLNTLSLDYNMLLGFGLQPHNVKAIVNESRLSGIALKGGNEIKPGYKDFDGLADILEVLEVDEGY